MPKGVLPYRRYRDQISVQCSGHMVLTIDTEERCLLLYPIDDWEEIQEKVNALPSFNPAARRLQRLLIGHATDLDMDGNGRLLIPSLLRESTRAWIKSHFARTRP